MRSSGLPPEFRRDVVQYNLLPLLLLNALLFSLHLFMLAEMLNVFWVNEVLDLCVLVVVFLKVVNLVLIFVVTMVSGPKAKVRKLCARLDLLKKGLFSDTTGLGWIEYLKYVHDS